MTNEEIIADFLKPPSEGGAYTDEKLAALLAHAEDGKLSFYSCCCFVAIPTADHALRGYGEYVKLGDPYENLYEDHYGRALERLDAEAAENAFSELSPDMADSRAEDAVRRARIIPLIKSEMQRRESLRSQAVVMV